MRNKSIFLILLLLAALSLKAQYTSQDFTLTDCDGKTIHLYSLLDKGKVVVLVYEHQCSSCVTGATNLTNVINSNYAGDTNLVVLYLDNGGFSCNSVKNWVSTKGFTPGSCFAYSNDYSSPYGSGMPVMVVTAGADRKVYLIAKSAAAANTTAIKTAIHDAFSGLASADEKRQEFNMNVRYFSGHETVLKIQNPSRENNCMLNVFESSGKLLLGREISLAEGENSIVLPLELNHNSLYLFRLQNGKQSFILKAMF